MKAKLGRVALVVAIVASFVASWALPAGAAVPNGLSAVCGPASSSWNSPGSGGVNFSTGTESEQAVYQRIALGATTTVQQLGFNFSHTYGGDPTETMVRVGLKSSPDSSVSSGWLAYSDMSLAGIGYGSTTALMYAQLSSAVTVSGGANYYVVMIPETSAGVAAPWPGSPAHDTLAIGTINSSGACSSGGGLYALNSSGSWVLQGSSTVAAVEVDSGSTATVIPEPRSPTCSVLITANSSGVASLSVTPALDTGQYSLGPWSWNPGDGAGAVTGSLVNHGYAMAQEPAGGWTATATATATAGTGYVFASGATTTVSCSVQVSFVAGSTNSGSTSSNPQSLGDCVPTGWNVLNPLALGGMVGCMFIPTTNPFSGAWAPINTALQTHAPFSWVSAVVAGYTAIVGGASDGEQGTVGSCGPRFVFDLGGGDGNPVGAYDSHLGNGHPDQFWFNLPNPTTGAASDGSGGTSPCPAMIQSGRIPVDAAYANVGGWQQKIGNVFGYIGLVRGIEVFAVWFSASALVIQMAPWSRIPFPSDFGPGGAEGPSGEGEGPLGSPMSGDAYGAWYEDHFYDNGMRDV